MEENNNIPEEYVKFETSEEMKEVNKTILATTVQFDFPHINKEIIKAILEPIFNKDVLINVEPGVIVQILETGLKRLLNSK